MMSRTGRIASVLAVALVVLTACGDDDNPFSATGEPVIRSFGAASTTVAEGTTATLNLSADGPRAIQRVRVSASGALTRDTVFPIAEAGSDIDAVLTLNIPLGTGPQSTMTVTAVAIDALDKESEPASLTLTVTDATDPQLVADVGPSVVGTGEPITIDLAATDNRGLLYVGARVRDGAGFDTTFADTITGSPLAYDASFQLVGPALDPTQLLVEPFATDVNGRTATLAEIAVGLTDREGPVFLMLETEPDSTVPLGASVKVMTKLFDPSGIRRVIFTGIAAIGDPGAGTDTLVEAFAPKVITYPRPTEGPELPEIDSLYPTLEQIDSLASYAVQIRVVAEDSLGNVSDTAKMVFTGGPDVRLEYPPDGMEVGVGTVLQTRIFVDDPSGVDSVILMRDAQRIVVPIPTRTDTPMVLIRDVITRTSPGTVTFQAFAWNRSEILGQSRPATVTVLATPPSDTVPPIVSLQATRLNPDASSERMELTDEIRIVASAFDPNAGLARIGIRAVASRNGVDHVVTQHATYGGSHNLEQLVFQIPVDSLYVRFGITGAATLDNLLPENIDLRIHAFAADTIGNVACSVGEDEQRPCTPSGYSPTTFYQASNAEGLLLELTAVRGGTIVLDDPTSLIADLAVDTIEDRLYLSNHTKNLVEQLTLDADIRASQFTDPIQVGSEPWGLFVGDRIVAPSEAGFGIGGVAAGDTARTLLVANSGGTNVSLVHLSANAASVEEVDVVRLRTPNTILYQLEEDLDEFGNTRYTGEWFDFSDRPQFLGQDSLLRIVYSTVPTGSAPTSTIRYGVTDPDPTAAGDTIEVRILLNRDMVNTDQETQIALANVDSVNLIAYSAQTDLVQVFSHAPGYPSDVLASARVPQITDAVADLRAQLDSVMTLRGVPDQAALYYPFLVRGTWDFAKVGMSDTTFISTSANRGRIAIGEGASQPTGRIILWHADECQNFSCATLSDEYQIQDLVNNASERVLGVGLNYDGSLGVARGLQTTYFFTPDLRLQGLYRQADQGGAGATFHPAHNEVTDGSHHDGDGAGVAFTGTPNRAIEVVNTFHFNLVNRIEIRDNVVGPLRSGPPLATDNVGLTCPSSLDCVVAKLYGITDAGGVVILNVRRRDLEPYATP